MAYKRSLPEIWGARVRQARRDLGISLEALSARSGIDLGHLSRGERGLAGFGDESRIRLAGALGKQVEELFPYPDTHQDDSCPSADSATDAEPSPTPATQAARRSPAPSAEVPAASAPEGSRGNE